VVRKPRTSKWRFTLALWDSKTLESKNERV